MDEILVTELREENEELKDKLSKSFSEIQRVCNEMYKLNAELESMKKEKEVLLRIAENLSKGYGSMEKFGS